MDFYLSPGNYKILLFHTPARADWFKVYLVEVPKDFSFSCFCYFMTSYMPHISDQRIIISVHVLIKKRYKENRNTFDLVNLEVYHI